MLSQLSYDPKYSKNKATRMGIEPTTSAVTGRRSNQLSHRATFIYLQNYTLSNIISFPKLLNHLDKPSTD